MVNKTFPHAVIYDGVFYAAGEEVPSTEKAVVDDADGTAGNKPKSGGKSR